MFTALQFLSCGQRRKGLSKPVFRVTVQAARKIGNASSLRWRTCRWKQVGDVSDHSFSHRVAWNIWKQHFQRVTESKWNGAETAQNKRKTCKKSFGTYLGARCREFESPHSDQLRLLKKMQPLKPLLRQGFQPFQRTKSSTRRDGDAKGHFRDVG